MLKVNNERQLLDILKIISEESVKKTKGVLQESGDTAQDRYMSNLKKSESMYGVPLTEEDEEAGNEDQESSVMSSEEPEAEEKDDSVKDETLGDTDEFGVSFDSVIKNINTLRAGRSTKDKEIKGELLQYYDRLEEDERTVLHIFLRELSRILRGAIDGSEAIDPSDAPVNADISIHHEDEDEPKREKSKPQTNFSGGEEDEDTAPPTPIKVNERQNLSEVRRKFKNLLKRI